MKAVDSLTKSSLLCLILPSIFSALQNSSSTELTSVCDQRREKIKEEMLPIILCGCSDLVLRSTANGFSVLVLLQRGFWIGLKSLHARNARFMLYSQPASSLNVLGDIKLKENETEIERHFKVDYKNDSSVQIILAYLFCDSTLAFSKESPCDRCKHIRLYYMPDRQVSNSSPRPTSLKVTANGNTDHVTYIVIILVVVVVCATISYVVYKHRKSRNRGISRQLDSINREPLVSTAESPAPKLTKELLIVDIAPNEVCSKRFRAFLRNLPKFSVVCYIDHLESVNENMYDWAHKKLKTCDFIIIVLTSELTDLFDSDTNNILQSSPFSDIVKYFLSQMNSSAYTNDSAKYCSVQFDLVELPSSFAEQLPNISFKNVFTLRDFANCPDVNASHFQLKKFLMTVGAENCEITNILRSIAEFSEKASCTWKNSEVTRVIHGC